MSFHHSEKNADFVYVDDVSCMGLYSKQFILCDACARIAMYRVDRCLQGWWSSLANLSSLAIVSFIICH